MPRPGRFTPGKDPVSIVQDAGWASGPVCTGAENLAPTGIQSPDCPARSELLYRLSYPAHKDTIRLPKWKIHVNYVMIIRDVWQGSTARHRWRLRYSYAVISKCIWQETGILGLIVHEGLQWYNPYEWSTPVGIARRTNALATSWHQRTIYST